MCAAYVCVVHVCCMCRNVRWRRVHHHVQVRTGQGLVSLLRLVEGLLNKDSPLPSVCAMPLVAEVNLVWYLW